MGSKNLRQQSVSFAKDVPRYIKAKFTMIKGATIGFIERLVGRPVTAATKKKAAMSITRRPEYIRHVVSRDPVATDVPAIKPGFVVVEQVNEVPVIIDIQDSVSCSTSIDVTVEEIVEDVPAVEEIHEVQSDIFDDGFDPMKVCGIGALAATSSASIKSTSSGPFVMDFDDWDLDTGSSSTEAIEETVVETAVPVAEETEEEKAFFDDLYDEIIALCLYEDVLPKIIPQYYEEIEFLDGLYKDLAMESIVNDVLPELVPEMFGSADEKETTAAEIIDAEQTVPAVAPVAVIETEEKKADCSAEAAFFENLFSDIEAYIIFNDILPQIIADETFVPDYVISDIGMNESAETQIEFEVPKEEESSPLDSFVNGSVTFSFGYSGSSESAGPTKFSFIMGTPEDATADDECEDSVRSNIGAEPVMAASQQSSRYYL